MLPPHCPLISVVMPCESFDGASGSMSRYASLCACASMKPGVTRQPVASMTVSASWVQSGPLGGYELIDIKATLLDGSYHEVDSSDIAFRIAGSLTVKEGITKDNGVLLEPMMEVEVCIPDEYLGDIPVDLHNLVAKRLSVSSVTNGGKNIPAAINFLATNAITTVGLPTRYLSFDTVDQAFAETSSAQLFGPLVVVRVD